MKSGENSAYKPLWGLFAILLLVTAATAISKYAFEREDKIPWKSDPAAAIEEAKRNGKPVLLYFTATWCGPCQKLKSETWSDASVETKLRGYIPVKIDVDQNTETAKQYEIDSMPTFIVLDKIGNTVKRSSGFMPADMFLEWLGS